MRFLNGLDLNLVLVLDALLATASVTESAKRLHVSQPTMSASLAKLRTHFSDDLLVRNGQKMVLTALGEQLRMPVSSLVKNIESTFELRSGFDFDSPHSSITLASSDHHLYTVLPTVLPKLYKIAPQVRLNFVPIAAGTWENMTRGTVDFLLSPASVISPKLNSAILFEDVFVCAVWSGNPLASRGISQSDYSSAGHVVAQYGETPGSEQRALERIGVFRRTELVVQSPSILAAALVGSHRIATLPRRLASMQTKCLPIELLPMPYALPPLQIALGWHPSRDNVPAIRWFRELLINAMREHCERA